MFFFNARRVLIKNFFLLFHGEYLIQKDGLLFDGMTDILTEVMSKKKIKVAGFKELIDGWIKLYSSIMKYVLRESVSENGDTEAKAQLMRAVTNAVKSDEMDKATMGGYLLSAISCLC